MNNFILKDVIEHKELRQICGIYLLKNLLTNKYYIGQSIDIYRRLLQHKNYCKNYIDQIIAATGAENFEVSILKICQIKELDDLERFFIEKYQSQFPLGYNITKGGQGQPGEENPQAILTEEDVINIRVLYSKFERNIIFMIFSNFTERTITSVISGQNWTHIPIYKKRGHTWSYPSSYSLEDKKLFNSLIKQKSNYFEEKIKEVLKDILYE